MPITGSQNSLSLYFHIPFCHKKCPYCHFYVVPDRPAFQNLLKESLAIEWEQKLPWMAGKEISSIYFGGGTPTLFAPDGIREILSFVNASKLKLAKDIEITIEANPEEASISLFQSLIALGVNRLSIGVQSLDDRSLNLLERTHSAKKAKESIWEAYKAGFQNISIDLMYDLPSQTETSWNYTLDQINELPIQHVSLYNLTIEPHTLFYKRQASLKQPDPVISLQLLHAAIAALEKMGFKRYEISAFAKGAFQSKHNRGYWTGKPFLGFGPSAFSYWEGSRFQNIANLQRYARNLKNKESPIGFSENLPFPKNWQELLAVRLRLLEETNLDNYPNIPDESMHALDFWAKEGCLARQGNMIRLTERGTLFYDAIASDIV